MKKYLFQLTNIKKKFMFIPTNLYFAISSERKMDITQLPITDISKQFYEKKITSKELTQLFLNKIKDDQNHDKPLNAITTLMNDKALSMADQADQRLSKGDKLPLLGIPIIIKDNINIKGVPSSCASKILDQYVATFDATVISKLREAGAVLIGKSNMDEFAMGSSSEHSSFGVVRNHVNRDYSPGGSSGGSATAISANWSPIALGSDTGGSIRQPASFCGIIGLKPTYGRVSRYGLIAYSSSLDQIGTFSNHIEDTALLLEVISGHDKMDSTSSSVNVPQCLNSMRKELKGLRVGLPKEYLSNELSPIIHKQIQQSADYLKSLGCEIIEVSLPHTEYGIPAYYIIATAEASSNLSRFDGIRYGKRIEGDNLNEVFLQSRSTGFGNEVKRRIILGTYVLSSGYYDAYYLKAQKVRTLIKQDFVEVFKKVDILLTPTSPTTAFKIGEKLNDPLQMYLSDIYTVNVNLAGLPGISIPYGKDDKGLPIGIQLIANYFQEEKLIQTSWHLLNK